MICQISIKDLACYGSVVGFNLKQQRKVFGKYPVYWSFIPGNYRNKMSEKFSKFYGANWRHWLSSWWFDLASKAVRSPISFIGTNDHCYLYQTCNDRRVRKDCKEGWTRWSLFHDSMLKLFLIHLTRMIDVQNKIRELRDKKKESQRHVFIQLDVYLFARIAGIRSVL